MTKKYVKLRDVLYRLVDNTVALCKNMTMYSCCNGPIGSESELFLKKMLELLQNITEKYNDAVLNVYLKDFEIGIEYISCNGYASNYKCDERLNMCKLKNSGKKTLDLDQMACGEFTKIQLPPIDDDVIYVKDGSIKEVNKFNEMIKLLNECIYN